MIGHCITWKFAGSKLQMYMYTCRTKFVTSMHILFYLSRSWIINCFVS